MTAEAALLVAGLVSYCLIAYGYVGRVWLLPALRVLEAEARLAGYRVPASLILGLGFAYAHAPLWAPLAVYWWVRREVRERWGR